MSGRDEVSHQGMLAEIEQFDEMGLSGDFFGGTVQSEAWGQDGFLSQTQLQRTKDRQPPNIKTATPLNIKIALEDRSRAEVTVDETFFAPGDRVFHQKFGMGLVISSDGDKLNINFDKNIKSLFSNFVKGLIKFIFSI